MKQVTKILAALIFFGLVAGMLTHAGVHPILAIALVVGVSYFASKHKGYRDAFMQTGGLEVEIWENHIEANLFKDSQYLLSSTDASQYVLNGKVVHIPQAGGLPNVVKNRSSLPATVTQRTDTDITYTLDEYTTDPILISNAETIQYSYDKRASVLSEHESALHQTIADIMLLNWAPSLATSILRTSGAATASTLPGTTGNRAKFGTAEVKKAQVAMNKQNIAMADRYCILSSDLYSQLIDDMTQTQYRDFSAVMDPKTGLCGTLFGFQIYQRSSVMSYNNAGTPVVNAYGAAANATDNDAALFWHRNAVERAIGQTKFFDRMGDPTFYGDIYSLLVRMGGRKRRTNEEGVIAVVQAAAS